MHEKMQVKMATAAVVALVMLMTAMLGGAGAAREPKSGPVWGVYDATPPNWGANETRAQVSSPLIMADTVGDSIYRKGDITSIKVVHRASLVRLILRTRAASNPATSPAWVVGYSNIQWAIDVNGGEPDFLVGGWNDGTQVLGEVVLPNASHTHVCSASFGALVDSSGALLDKLLLSFPRSCISNPSSIRVVSRMEFDKYPTDPDAPHSEDISPNGAVPTPFVTL